MRRVRSDRAGVTISSRVGELPRIVTLEARPDRQAGRLAPGVGGNQGRIPAGWAELIDQDLAVHDGGADIAAAG